MYVSVVPRPLQSSKALKDSFVRVHELVISPPPPPRAMRYDIDQEDDHVSKV